ncbi:uracil DNA glycosylase superfamily protein [bacterium BMS3Abin03]|nr:uracil DNA glycosylase superfamily protein [bacterium BMS3Abin03]
MRILTKIENYYKDNGILSTHFVCPYKKVCKGNNNKFYGPKSTFISSGYEKGNLPKLLFLSLDPGKSEKDSVKRLPKSIRGIEEKRDISLLPKNRHWYKTHELAFNILKRFNDDLTIDDVKHYFAHANTVKCSMNNPHRKQAHKILFKNCRDYLISELEILSPDIIVTQGNEAKLAIEKFIFKSKLRTNRYYQIVTINNKKVFWLHTFHPHNYGAFYKQYNKGKGWENYSKRIYDWYVNYINA